jgi:predicted DNA-binding ribbon-helix-helix protein
MTRSRESIGKRQDPSARSTLVNRNVVIDGHRTSMRLESSMWEALEEIAAREGLSVSQLCEQVDRRRRQSSLTAAMRVFIVSYFRTAATEHGHADAGHGTLYGAGRLAAGMRQRTG